MFTVYIAAGCPKEELFEDASDSLTLFIVVLKDLVRVLWNQGKSTRIYFD